MAHEASNDNPYTRGIAQFVSSLQYDAIPRKSARASSSSCSIRWAARSTAPISHGRASSRRRWGGSTPPAPPRSGTTDLLEGDCGVDQFTEDKVDDPERMAYGEKVEVHHDAEITAKGSKYRHMVRVELHLKDGTCMERTVESARGSEYKFASEADIVDKFEKLSSKALPRPQVEALRDAMLGLDTLSDAAKIAQLLARS